MSLVFCGICPHPPIVVPEVGGKEAGKLAKTQQAMLEIGRRIKNSGAQVLVMISPHSPVFRDAIAINSSSEFKGDLADFRAPQVSFNFKGDQGLAEEIRQEAAKNKIMTVELSDDLARQYEINIELDHGLMVPLYFLQREGIKLPLVAISMGLLSYEELYVFGMAVRKAIQKNGQKAALLTSGDLSHRLTADAPAGYDPEGEVFDREIVRLVSSANVKGLMEMDPELIERAGECGFRPIIMTFGALDGYEVKSEVLSYEGPFGVGYMVASLIPVKPAANREFGGELAARKKAKSVQRRRNESYLVSIARKSLESKVQGRSFQVDPDDIPEEFQKQAGVFVSLKKCGQLRGCIGTVFPQRRNIVEEVANNALSAGLDDPRFYPVQEEELDDLVYSVDVLTEPEPIKSINDLDPVKYGVIVRSGHRSGLLLPNLEGINTPEEQVSIARQKAGIDSEEKVELERFEVIRYS